MDDLRWILLLVGVVVVAAIYFSGRFEGADWARERKQLREQKHDKTAKKARRKKSLFRQPSTVAQTIVKKEPGMGMTEPAPVAEKPECVKEYDEKYDEECHEQGDASSTHAVDSTPVVAPTIKTGKKVAADNTSEIINSEQVGIEDEITGIEIPADLAVAEAEIYIADSVPDEKPEQAELPPGIEPLVLSVSVFAAEDESFGGQEIKEALEAEGLLHGAMRIFHFYDPDKKHAAENDDAVFSVASVLEPGFFDLEKLDEMQTPGLMLFCQLPGPLPGEAALEVMLDKGRGLAVRLHGQMCDDRRNPFTSQAKTYYQDKIATFSHELGLARKKADV